MLLGTPPYEMTKPEGHPTHFFRWLGALGYPSCSHYHSSVLVLVLLGFRVWLRSNPRHLFLNTGVFHRMLLACTALFFALVRGLACNVVLHIHGYLPRFVLHLRLVG